MYTVFKFNRAIVTNTSKYNLPKGFDFKSQYNLFCHKSNAFCQSLNEI